MGRLTRRPTAEVALAGGVPGKIGHRRPARATRGPGGRIDEEEWIK
jgi:hypothetical protein